MSHEVAQYSFCSQKHRLCYSQCSSVFQQTFCRFQPQEFRLSTELLKDGSFDVISELRLLPGLPIDTFSVGVSKLVNESRQKYICTVKQQDLSLGKSISECVTVELLCKFIGDDVSLLNVSTSVIIKNVNPKFCHHICVIKHFC